MDLIKIENKNIYEFHASEKLKAEDANRLMRSFKEFKENGEKINLLGVIKKLSIPDDFSSFDDILKMKIYSLGVIKKYAILSNKNWLNTMVPAANFFTPNIPIKTFEMHERDKAIAWLEDMEIKTYSPEEYLAEIEIEELRNGVYEVEFTEDKLSHAAVSALYDLFNKKSEKINLLLILRSFPSIENLKTLVKGIEVDLKAIGKVGKYGIVTDEKWLDRISDVLDFMTPGMDVRVYKISAIEEAREWIVKG
ncbi:STAS/SEC14 domain-containing protein [Eudoraea chungangensis]|uniref:STAS/SEC14 domain-containing protein n=1 Tax=Eudoraea chungangensis TaxID=1481905 RepID=UPI0023ED18B2|nr:STAS/SEC14 domain-containing protein [Eudoraea chungangensis]